MIFAWAESCDFSNQSQKSCEIDTNNPPIFLHKFVDSNNNTSNAYGACVYDGTIQLDEEYEVINCSSVTNNELLTEGVIITNALDSSKNIELTSNIHLIVAGDLVVGKGVHINGNGSKKLILEMLEGTNGKSSIVLEEGASLNANSIIMPSENKSLIQLNNSSEGEETIINANELLSASQNGESFDTYSGDIICGSVDLKNTNVDFSSFLQNAKIASINEKCKISNETIIEGNITNLAQSDTQKPTQPLLQDDTQDNTISDKETNDNIITPNIITSSDNGFLIIEQEAFDKVNRECQNNNCLIEKLLPYDGVISNKFSSKNKVYPIYIINLTNENFKVDCEVTDYYGKNTQSTLNLNENKLFEKIDLSFPQSNDSQTQITCKSPNQTKTTNKISVTPAKFVLNPRFGDADFEKKVTLKAGVVDITFEDSKALNLEGEIDNGFNGKLSADSSNFKFQSNQCQAQNNSEIFTEQPMLLSFKNGKLESGGKVSFIANTITNGKLDITFNIQDNATCKNNCTKTTISKNINVIPANFMLKTDIITPYNISYYGQIDDRNAFKYNPILDIKLNALNNKDEIIDLNQGCNHSLIQLSLDSPLLIEFKRSVSDRLNSKINIYTDEFDNNKTANIQVYFGMTKIVDEFNNSRKIKQNDLIEPQVIKLTDLSFNAQYNNNGRFYDYNDLIVYDRLVDNSNPMSVMIARGNLQPSIEGGSQNPQMIAKYEIFCQTCDTKLLAKYLEVDEIVMDIPNWYINTKHPAEFYLDNQYIKTTLDIRSSSQANGGVQKIVFRNNASANDNISINQNSYGFAPYLNYNKDFKNIYLEKSLTIDNATKSPSLNTNTNPNREDKIDEVFDKYIQSSAR